MQLFYSADIKNDFCVLNEEESRHCVQVLRNMQGSQVYVIDGKGGFFRATVIDAQPKKCSLQIQEKLAYKGKHPYYLHIAMAPTKNIDRFEWFIEKAIEIGIDEITPLICEHSERKIVKMDRIEKLVMSAMKQSFNIVKPQLNSCVSFGEFMKTKRSGSKYIAHCHQADKLVFKHCLSDVKEIHVLIGPEGDFGNHEVEKAKEEGYQPISLGDTRLRTETAGLLACCTVATLLG